MPTKTLLILSGFLLLFILGAGGFYLYTQNKTRPSVVEEGPRDFSLARSLAPTPMPAEIITINPVNTGKIEEALKALGETDADFFSYSYVTNIYKGEVVEAVQSSEEFEGVTYSGKIVLTNKDGKIFTLRFSQKELDNMEISSIQYLENGDYTIESTDFGSVIPGDSVSLSKTTNLLDPNLNSDRVGIEIKR